MIEVKKYPLQRILISMGPDYKTLTDETPVNVRYCHINSKKMQAIIVATRGFSTNDSTIII
ncbi:MAG: hypothetical protein WCB31_01505 [Nitrososphaeraceae archaeon]